tara:strand:+ start:6 stop:575 length:570 start_codon:yes stop_codon:yes gene_type:complete
MLFFQIALTAAFIFVLHLAILCILKKQQINYSSPTTKKKQIPIIWNLKTPQDDKNGGGGTADDYDKIQDNVDMAKELMKVMEDDIYQPPTTNSNLPIQLNIESPYSPNPISDQSMPVESFFKDEKSPNFVPPEEWGVRQKTIMEGSLTTQSKSNRMGKDEKVINGGDFFKGLQGYDNFETSFDFLPKKE